MKTDRQRGTALLLSLLCLLLAANACAQGTAIHTADANLETQIRRALAKPSGPITDVDMESLTTLVAEEARIVDLTGLEHASNVTELSLGDNEIIDLSPISGLTSLTRLEAYGNRIVDLGLLANLRALERLGIGLNDIVDLEPLRDLTTLTFLFLHNNDICDTSPLIGLDQLEQLSVSDNSIATLELSDSDRMQYFYADATVSTRCRSITRT